MFFTYLRRELRRRRKAALVVASGLALGIALVIVVNSVSSGMNQAQDKVLQSLYGLGTDMTVTKAAEAPKSGETGRPRFEFGAKDDGEEQSSDRVMVQGFQTLASSTVTKVAGQKGVADSVGGLSLQVMKVSGEFKRGQFKQDQSGGTTRQGGPGGSGGQSQGRVEGGGASFDVNSYSVYGTDVTKQGLGPLTSSKVTKGRTFKTSETDAKVAVADTSYAKEKKLALGGTVKIKGVKYKLIGIATPDSGDAAANLYVPLKQAQTLMRRQEQDHHGLCEGDRLAADLRGQGHHPEEHLRYDGDHFGGPRRHRLRLPVHRVRPRGERRQVALHRGARRRVPRRGAAHLVCGLPPRTGVRHAQGARLEVRPRHPPGRRRGRRQRARRRRPRHSRRPRGRLRRHRDQPHPHRRTRLRRGRRRQGRRHGRGRPGHAPEQPARPSTSPSARPSAPPPSRSPSASPSPEA